MGTAGRPRRGIRRGRRGSANTRNRAAHYVPGLQTVVRVRRHRPVSAERAGPVQSVRLAGVPEHRNATVGQTSRGHRLGKNQFR